MRPLKPHSPELDSRNPLSRGLICAYALREGGGDVTYDHSAVRNEGFVNTLTGDPIWVQTREGHALLFGTNDECVFVPVGNGFPLYDAQRFTIAMLMYGPSTVDDDARFYAEGSSSSSTPFYGIGSGATDPAKVRVFLRDDSSGALVNVESGLDLFDNQWHVLVWTDNAGEVGTDLSIDGLSDTAEYGTDYTYTRASMTVDRPCIGALRRSNISNECDCEVAGFLAWDRVLGSSEIKQLNNDFFSVLRPKHGAGLLVPDVPPVTFNSWYARRSESVGVQ